MGYVSHAQRKAVWASKKDGGKGNPNKKGSPAKKKDKFVLEYNRKDAEIELDGAKLGRTPTARDSAYASRVIAKRRKKGENVQKNYEFMQKNYPGTKTRKNIQYKAVEGKAKSPFEMKAKTPLMAKISASCKARAKKKFKVWPSAYASGWGVRCTRGDFD